VWELPKKKRTPLFNLFPKKKQQQQQKQKQMKKKFDYFTKSI